MLGSRKVDTTGLSVGTGERGAGAGGYVSPFHVASAADAAKDSVHSIVDKHLTMRGDLESDGDILVRGKVIGNITCKMLIVDVDAQIDGGITADEVIIRGRAKGKIQAERVRLEKTANVDCEIAHRMFAAEEGARIKGSLHLMEDGVSAKDKIVKEKDVALAA